MGVRLFAIWLVVSVLRHVPGMWHFNDDLYVQEAVRRQHVASQLLSVIESYAWSFGASRVTLNVARTNVSAQQVYAARGWQQDEQFFMFHRFPENK